MISASLHVVLYENPNFVIHIGCQMIEVSLSIMMNEDPHVIGVRFLV